jgi:hypothetical protein
MVMVGAVKWCVLVTLAVMVPDGSIVVGPDNRVFYPNQTSKVWIKKEAYGELIYLRPCSYDLISNELQNNQNSLEKCVSSTIQQEGDYKEGYSELPR